MSARADAAVARPLSAIGASAQEPVMPPATLRVFRYRPGDEHLRTIVGHSTLRLPHAELSATAAEALARRTFMFSTLPPEGDCDAEELCFVPRGDYCDILNIHTYGWRPRRGDIRRSLIDILNDLATAVACGGLRILDASELAEEESAGERLCHLSVDDTASLTRAREAADSALRDLGVEPALRHATVLGVSEAATNALMHGGGGGRATLRRVGNRLRIVISDSGRGLNFLNWGGRRGVDSSPSMGYGFKIILDSLDAVGLFTSPFGTTLILDRVID